MNQIPLDSITAIVLAGGQSSRMGQDKALLKIHHQPLLREICCLARECASQVYVVTPWPERYQSILPSSCRLIQETWLPQEKTSHGPLIGFAQGLTQVQTEWVLLLACDLPNLKASEVKKWSEYLTEVPEEAIALLPRNPKGWEPLCGFYRRRCHPLLNDFIQQGGRSFQQWLAQCPVQELPVNNPDCLFNCNTPTDLEKLKDEIGVEG